MKIGISITEFIKTISGKPLEEMNFTELKDSFLKAVRIMKSMKLTCAEISVPSLEILEKIAKITAEIDYYFTLHEMSKYSAANLSYKDEPKRKEVIDGLKATIDYASEGNIKVIVIHPASYNPGKKGYAYEEISHLYFEPSKAWKISIELLKEIANYASRKGVILGLENMPIAIVYHDELVKTPHFGVFKKEIINIISSVNNESLRITFDVGHANTVCQPYDYIKGIVNKVIHIHLHDNDGRYDQHAPLGTGTVNLYLLFKVLKEEGYDHSIVIERPIDDRIFEDINILKYYMSVI